MISRSHMRTHASKPNHFGSWVLWDWVFSINSTCFSFNIVVSECDTPIQEYRVGTWHSDPRIPCRNVTLRSKNIVSKRDTPIQKYCVGTWHSDPRIQCRNVTLRSNYTINLSFIITAFNSLLYYFHQALFIQDITSIDRIREYKFYGLRILDQSQTTQPNHTITQSST